MFAASDNRAATCFARPSWRTTGIPLSLVEPRPAPPREVEGYDMWHRRRLSVAPGIIGLWQVEARFDDQFDDRAELDMR
jgi:lipopolysaccharide/colanic/teichoic acid biosynthesis glycosyltransferase